MSYCRWSSDNGRSDVYVYEDVSGGWTTHVATRKKAWAPIPTLPLSLLRPGDALLARVARYLWLLSYHLNSWSNTLIPFRNLNLPHDGESFNHDTPGECADWLEHLRRLGYYVPQNAIDALREEGSKP